MVVSLQLKIKNMIHIKVTRCLKTDNLYCWDYLLEYFKKHNYQSNHPKSENIDHTEFKNDIQNIVVLEMAKSGHFENLAKFNI